MNSVDTQKGKIDRHCYLNTRVREYPIDLQKS